MQIQRHNVYKLYDSLANENQVNYIIGLDVDEESQGRVMQFYSIPEPTQVTAILSGSDGRSRSTDCTQPASRHLLCVKQADR